MFQQHPEFEQIDDSKLLWRYMDLPRYIDLLIKKKMFFCRADRFEDPFEGRYNNLSQKELIQENSTNKALPDKQNNFEALLQQHQHRRMATTLNCWHQNNDENYAMWQIYAKGDFGLAIQTNYKSLKKAFDIADECIYIGRVNYIDETTETISLKDSFTPFLMKRNIYNYENEIRCCHIITDKFEEPYSWDRCNEQNGMFTPIDLSRLIQKIYISPNSPKWFKEVVIDINEKYDIHTEVVQSTVFESLHYSY